jgi:HlyD family secretion protein
LAILGFVWSVVGQIPVTVSGEGVLLFPREVVKFQSPLAGQLKELRVAAGDRISKDSDQIIAIIEPLELQQQKKLQEIKLQELQKQATEAERLELQQLELAKISLDQQSRNLEGKIKDLQSINPQLNTVNKAAIEEQKSYLKQQLNDAKALVSVLKERLERRKAIYEDGAISRDQVLDAEQDYRTNLQKISQLKAELKRLDLEVIEQEKQTLDRASQIAELRADLTEINRQKKALETQYFTTKTERSQQILAVQQEIQKLEAQIRNNSIIKSPYNGTIIELAIAEGQMVTPGTNLGLIQTDQMRTKSLMSVNYFSVADGKKIEPGMMIQVTPKSIKRERFGGILATVKSVSTFPVSKESVIHLTGNVAIAESLLKDLSDPQIEVWATLETNPDNFTGYQWSSSTGPDDLKISPGTTTSARITIENRAPITFVLPFLKQFSGIE